MEADALFAEARRAMGEARGLRLREKPFHVGFHPYAGLRSIIHDRGDHYEVRASDLLQDAPDDVLRGLARLLIGKIDRRLRSTPSERAAYLAWSRDEATLARHQGLRRERGRGKRIDPARGQVHDLDALFDRLNATCFGGRVAKPTLGWSRAVNRHLYGHHDPDHDAIVLNRLLDHPRVPEAVVADILHHEMLHVVHGVQRGAGGRRVLHSRAFRLDEKRFDLHGEAKAWLRALEARRIRLRALPRRAGTAPSRPATPAWRRVLQATLEAWSA